MNAWAVRSQLPLASAILAALAVGCTPAIPLAPLATDAPPSLKVTWDVTVTGEVDASYSVVNTPAYSVYSVSKAVILRLPSADGAFEVVLLLPDDVESGTYAIPDAFAQLPTAVAARFAALSPPSRHYYESSGGTIEVSGSGQYLSGEFEFAARNSFTGGSITVNGIFNAIPWGY